MSEISGKNEALTMLLEQERQNARSQLDNTRERLQEQNLELEKRIVESKDQWDSKYRDADRWKQRLEDENAELKSIIQMFKTQGTSKKNDNISQELAKGLSKLDSNVAKDVSYIRESLQSFTLEMKELHQEKFDLRLKYEMESEMAQMEKRHSQQLNDAKMLSSNVIDKLRESYEVELREEKDQIKQLEQTKELHLVKLVEKEGHVLLSI